MTSKYYLQRLRVKLTALLSLARILRQDAHWLPEKLRHASVFKDTIDLSDEVQFESRQCASLALARPRMPALGLRATHSYGYGLRSSPALRHTCPSPSSGLPGAICGLALFGLSSIVPINAYAADEQVVNLYSARKEELILPLLRRFTEQTGVKVNLITGKADALLKRLEVEGQASPADVFITVDAGRLHRAKEAGVLRPINSDVLVTVIPERLRDDEGYWVGLSQRARTIFYAKNKVSPDELSTYEALVDPQWEGRICIRSSSNIYNQSLVASMIVAMGEEQTEAWAEGLVANFAKPPGGGDTDQLRAAAAGVCDLAIANTYYFGRLVNSDKAADREVANKLAVFWPNQGEGDRGVHVNVSGAGVTKHSKNSENAIALIEFLASPESQAWYAAVNNEYPVVEGVEISETLKGFGEFRADDVALSKLGENNRAAVELMDRAGWK